MRPRVRQAAIAVVAVVLLGGLAAPVPAGASYDPVDSGTAKVILAKRFARFLAADRVKLAPKSGARRHGRAYLLPIVGGIADPTIGKGTIETSGALVFQGSRNKVPLRHIVLKTKPSPLIAKVGGSQLKVASGAKLAFKRSGFGSLFTATKLKLTAKVATRLNKKLRPARPFQTGQVFGTAISALEPLTTAILPEGRATLQLSAEFAAKLQSLFVAANPIFPAEHQGPTFTLPIAPAGAISPLANLGTLATGGSIEFLQLGSNSQVLWHEFFFELGPALASPELDSEPAPPLAGKVGRTPIAALGLGAVSAEPAARTITDAAAPLSLGASTAALFNQAFAEGKEVFKAGEPFAALSFTAQAQ